MPETTPIIYALKARYSTVIAFWKLLQAYLLYELFKMLLNHVSLFICLHLYVKKTCPSNEKHLAFYGKLIMFSLDTNKTIISEKYYLAKKSSRCSCE